MTATIKNTSPALALTSRRAFRLIIISHGSSQILENAQHSITGFITHTPIRKTMTGKIQKLYPMRIAIPWKRASSSECLFHSSSIMALKLAGSDTSRQTACQNGTEKRRLNA